MSSKQKQFLPQDRQLLEARANVSWIPKDPAKLLLPYMEKEAPGEKSNIKKRLEKAQKVMASYQRIEETCKRIEDEISNRCKNVVIKLDENKDSKVIQACERAFGIEGIREITFEMYKTAVKALSDISGSITPRPGENK